MAFALTIGIFLYFLVLGNAILAGFIRIYNRRTIFFLSPAIGLAIYVTLIFILSKLNFPLKDISIPLTYILLSASLGWLIYKKYSFICRDEFFYLVLGLISAVFTGFALLMYGFNWLSVGNDDMANYALGAQRFINFGYFYLPDSIDLKAGVDYSQSYWVLHSLIGVRSGSELLLGSISNVTGVDAIRAFMSTVLALQIIQIFSAISLVAICAQRINQLKFTSVFLVFSPLIMLGTILQLIGQVGGLALLCVSMTLMLDAQRLYSFPIKSFEFLSVIFLRTLIIFSLIVWYPETLPIFLLALGIYLLIVKFVLKIELRRYIAELFLVAFLVIALMGNSIQIGLDFLLYQIFYGSSLQDLNTEWSALLFPYYLLPSGIAVLWGLLPLSGIPPEPENSALIIVGICLFIWTISSTLRSNLRAFPNISSALLGLTLLGAVLFKSSNGFGLFKLAMFITPFLLSVLALNFSNLNLKHFYKVLWICPVLFLIYNLRVIDSYQLMSGVVKNFDKTQHSFDLSQNKVSEEYIKFFKELKPQLDSDAVIISETSNMFLAKLQAFYSRGKSIYFPSSDFFLDRYSALGLKKIDINVLNSSQQYKNYEIAGIKFKLLNKDLFANKKVFYIGDNNKFDIFNSYYRDENQKSLFKSYDFAKNRLIFINSTEGANYYSLYRKKSAFYPLENDPFFPGNIFASFNRIILVEAINPSTKSRLVLNLTNTPTHQFNGKLPQPTVNGLKLDIVGSGSARIYSKPIKYIDIDGHKLILLDMERDGKPFGQNKSALMSAYGKNVLLDSRYVNTFLRDFSLVSNEDFNKLEVPTFINNFPKDLSNQALEYSGIYENGDLSADAFVNLYLSPTAKYLKLQAAFPKGGIDLADKLELKIYIDGVMVDTKILKGDRIDYLAPLKLAPGRHKVEIKIVNQVDGKKLESFIRPNISFLGFI